MKKNHHKADSDSSDDAPKNALSAPACSSEASAAVVPSRALTVRERHRYLRVALLHDRN